MSKNKRWYFIKLPEDFLESDPIEWLLTQDEGGNYFSMYILLCKIALNTEGRLVRLLGDMEVPYTPEDLSHKWRGISSCSILFFVSSNSSLSIDCILW